MDTNPLVLSIRDKIEQKHRDALVALETLAAYLNEPASASVEDLPPPPLPQPPAADGGGYGSKVSMVLDAVVDSFKSVDEIMGETGLPENAVRAALYSKSSSKRLIKKKIKNVMHFKIMKEFVPTERRIDEVESSNIAELVRVTLSQHPKGMTSAEIHAALETKVNEYDRHKKATGAALYNLKKHEKLSHDPRTGIYILTEPH